MTNIISLKFQMKHYTVLHIHSKDNIKAYSEHCPENPSCKWRKERWFTWRLTITILPPPLRHLRGKLQAGVICKLQKEVRLIKQAKHRIIKIRVFSYLAKWSKHESSYESLITWYPNRVQDQPFCNVSLQDQSLLEAKHPAIKGKKLNRQIKIDFLAF